MNLGWVGMGGLQNSQLVRDISFSKKELGGGIGDHKNTIRTVYSLCIYASTEKVAVI